MSKITNDGLIQSGTGCFIAVPMAIVGVKGLSSEAATIKRGGVLNEKHTHDRVMASHVSQYLCATLRSAVQTSVIDCTLHLHGLSPIRWLPITRKRNLPRA